jgi:hypothetical protein
MCNSRILSALAISFAIVSLCGCTDVVGLAHGDPGRDSQEGTPTPLVGAATGSEPSQAAPSGSSASAQPRMSPGAGAVSAVSVTLSDTAQQIAAADPRLDAAAVTAALEQELQAHQLLVVASPSVHSTLTITVDDFTTELASNASVLGYTFRSAVLTAEVTVQEGSALVRPSFTVHARVRLTTRDTGGRSASLEPLFARFAQVVVADLRGVEPPSEPIPR